MAKSKSSQQSPARPAQQRKANNSKHGRTFCRWCRNKIARGMIYCNTTCREVHTRFIGGGKK